MPRQRIDHSRIVYAFPEDFPQRLKRFQQESGLPWAELDRRLGIDPETRRRWRDKGVRPSTRHYAALVKLADSLGLGHIFTEQGGGTSAMACDPQGLKRKKGRTYGRSFGGMFPSQCAWDCIVPLLPPYVGDAVAGRVRSIQSLHGRQLEVSLPL